MRYYYIKNRMSKQRSLTKPKNQECVRKCGATRNLIQFSWQYKLFNNMVFSIKLNICIAYMPEILCLGIYLREMLMCNRSRFMTSCIVHNRQKLEITQLSINSRIWINCGAYIWWNITNNLRYT